MARRFPIAISQAPGFSGMPPSGHCSSAASSASWASSSASPTSRTTRVSPAISRADSIRQTASTARWVSATTVGFSRESSAPRQVEAAPRSLDTDPIDVADLSSDDPAEGPDQDSADDRRTRELHAADPPVDGLLPPDLGAPRSDGATARRAHGA